MKKIAFVVLTAAGAALVTTFTPAPEPVSMALLGIGLAGFGLLRFRSRRLSN